MTVAVPHRPEFHEVLCRFPTQILQLRERFDRALPFLAIMGHETSALSAALKREQRMSAQGGLVADLQEHLQPPDTPDTPAYDKAAADRLPIIHKTLEMLDEQELSLQAGQAQVDKCRAQVGAAQEELATLRTYVAAARLHAEQARRFSVARAHRLHNATSSPLLTQIPPDLLKGIVARAGPPARAVCSALRDLHTETTTTLALRPDPRGPPTPSSRHHPAGPALHIISAWPAPECITAAHSTAGLPADLSATILARLPALSALTISAPADPDPANPLDSQLWALAAAPTPPPLTSLQILTPSRIAWEVVAPWAPTLVSLTLAPYGDAAAALPAFASLTALTVMGASTFHRHVHQSTLWAALPSLRRLARLAVHADLAWGSADAADAIPLLTSLTHLDTTLRAPQFGAHATAPAPTPLPPTHDHTLPLPDPSAAYPPADAPGPILVAAALSRLPALASAHLRGASALLPLSNADLAAFTGHLARVAALSALHLTGRGACEEGALRALDLSAIATLRDVAVTWTDHAAAPLSAETLFPAPHAALRTLTLDLDGLHLAPTLHHTTAHLPALTHLHFLAGPAAAESAAAAIAAAPPAANPAKGYLLSMAAANPAPPRAPAPAALRPVAAGATSPLTPQASPTTPLDPIPSQPGAPENENESPLAGTPPIRVSFTGIPSSPQDVMPPNSAPKRNLSTTPTVVPTDAAGSPAARLTPLLTLLAQLPYSVSVDLTRLEATPRDVLALLAVPTLRRLALGRIHPQHGLPRCLAAARRLRSLQALDLHECRVPMDAHVLQHLTHPHPNLRELVVPDAATRRVATRTLGRYIDVVRTAPPVVPHNNC